MANLPRIALILTGGTIDSVGKDRLDLAWYIEAGKRLGSFHYRKDWSFGSPLKMPAALRRALVPALEKFCKVDATDTQVALPESPFCGTGTPVNCCEFITGFMQGFLDAGPKSMYTKVQQATCKAKGHTHCTYTVAYEL